MIPYAICRGTIFWSPDFIPLEIRLLELGRAHCTFRLPLRFRGLDGKVEQIEFTFVLRTGAVRVCLKADFTLTEKTATRFWVEWELSTKDQGFRTASEELSREYLDYIHSKLTLEEGELSHYLTGSYPLEEEFCHSLEEQYALWHREVMEGLDEASWEEIKELSLGAALENKTILEKFLSQTKEAFWNWYLHSTGLEAHPLAKRQLNFLAVGNPYCPLQGPDFLTMKRILEKAASENLGVMYVLPPVSEGRAEETKAFFRAVHDLLLEDQVLEVEVGDSGMERWLWSFPKLKISQGILMKKRLCDPRLAYQDHRNMEEEPGVLRMPLRQMNTGTFCTLHAAVVHGDRGHQERVRECAGYCVRQGFLYPKNLHMIGHYNSLLFADLSRLKNGSAAKRKGKVLLNYWMKG